MHSRLLALTLVLGTSLAVSACMGCGRSTTNVETMNTTVGQEMMDLEKARDSGAITQEQYEEQKKKILKR